MDLVEYVAKGAHAAGALTRGEVLAWANDDWSMGRRVRLELPDPSGLDALAGAAWEWLVNGAHVPAAVQPETVVT